MTIGILGGGVWGSALAKLFSNQEVLIYTRDKKVMNSINDHHFNPKLKYAIFNDNVKATDDLEEIVKKNIIFIALPSQSIREVLSKSYFYNLEADIIIASKVIEISSSMFLSSLVESLIKPKSLSIMSGPCFSDEVAQDLPTAATFASSNTSIFDIISGMLKSKKFRIYYSVDIIGCQIGGALKNIYAIAAGISDGLNLGENARSALLTRSFVEISRFATFFKSKKETLFGLSGLGDLMLTCNSSKSRNKNFGIKIANIKHKNFEKELDKNAITEGYFTAKAAIKIASENSIEMPILESVFNILYNGFDIEDEINKLMSRPLTIENIN
ncbi:NAD(P)-dependent glycerol-3-phosphate dehydrogenase [Alphaproteobacteria bacterium]|nr:NAD(P)-dependent glycerol-3-phosphate dehydrogenase [Alphaproteobacteria bacterium]